MLLRTYVTIAGGYRAILEPRYRFVPGLHGQWVKQVFVRFLGSLDTCPYPVSEGSIRSRVSLGLIKGGKA